MPGTATFEREKDLSIENNVRDLLAKIDRALKRIADGSYGTCDRCGSRSRRRASRRCPTSTSASRTRRPSRAGEDRGPRSATRRRLALLGRVGRLPRRPGHEGLGRARLADHPIDVIPGVLGSASPRTRAARSASARTAAVLRVGGHRSCRADRRHRVPAHERADVGGARARARGRARQPHRPRHARRGLLRDRSWTSSTCRSGRCSTWPTAPS